MDVSRVLTTRPAGREIAAACLIAAAALALRLAGIDWGLPFTYDPDEPDFVDRAFRMVETGNLDPGWFGHPGSTTMYGFWLAFSALATAKGGSVAELAAAFHAEPSDYYLVARWVVAAFGAGTVALTWLLARRVAAGWPALLAAGMLAVAPLHVQLSRVARPDVQLGFFAVATLLCAVLIAERGRRRDYLAAGFALGFATATKYPAFAFALPIALAHVVGRRSLGLPPWSGIRLLGAAALAALAGVVVAAPYLLLSLPTAYANVVFEARSYHLSGTSAGFWSSLGWYLLGPLLGETGLAGGLLAVAGTVVVVRRRQPSGLLVLVTAAAFLVFISTLSLRWERWVIPVAPLACVLAAAGIDGLRAALSGAVRVAVTGFAAILAIGLPAASTMPWTVAAARAETRDIAWQWLMDNAPPGSRILLEAYTPQLPPDRYRLYGVSEGRIWPLPARGRDYAVPAGVIGGLREPADVARSGMDFVVIANHYDRRLAERERYLREIGVYEEIMGAGELALEVQPAPYFATGLPVRIYRVRR